MLRLYPQKGAVALIENKKYNGAKNPYSSVKVKKDRPVNLLLKSQKYF
jgi:hypothetical protein